MAHPVHSTSEFLAQSQPAATAAGAAQTQEQAWPSRRRAWYAVVIFAVALMFNFLDRGIVNLLVEPMKRDLHLTDTQVSLLMGFAFVIFYMILGLPIARLVDSRSRRAIIGVGITIWSIMTAACGLAQTFWHLFLCRVGVGVGEACNGPATYSMMADLFPQHKLPRAIAVMNFGFAAGTGIAAIIGGVIIHFVSTMPPVHVPIAGTLHPWQLTFFFVGVPGLIVAIAMTTVQEPARRGLMGVISKAEAARRAIPIREVVRFMRENWSTYVPMFMGLAFQSVVAFGVQSWTPSLFVREYGWTIPQFGVINGLVVLVATPAGLIPGSMLAEWFARRGHDDANMRVTLYALLGYLPAAILFPLMPTAPVALAVLGIGMFVNALSIGAQNAALQVVTPNEMRGQVTALFLFVFNIIGFGLGPTFIALFTDYVFGNEAQLRYAITTATAIMGPIAALIIWSGLKPYGRSVARARAWS